MTLLAFFKGTKEELKALENEEMLEDFLEAAASLREGYKPTENRHLIVKHEI